MVLTVLSSIDPPHGFHRTISTSITLEHPDWIHLVAQNESQNEVEKQGKDKEETEPPCSLHLYYNLPLLVFVDPYELANYQHLYTFQHYGNANLELPVAAMDSNGTSLILKLNPKLVSLDSSGSQVDVKDIKVPTHLRYGEISDSTSHRSAEMAWPELFLSCGLDVSAPDSMSLTSYNLPEEFMSRSSSSDGFGFEGRALSRPIQSSQPQTFSATANQSNRTTLVSAPVGHSADLTQVRLGTSLTIMVMFCYLAYVSYSTARRLGKRSKVE
ncbi:PIG-X [Lentinula raphanica]|nr:PIG-X [Lentinula raphanica]